MLSGAEAFPSRLRSTSLARAVWFALFWHVVIGVLTTIPGLIEGFAAVAVAEPAQKSARLSWGISGGLYDTTLGTGIAMLSLLQIPLLWLAARAIRAPIEMRTCAVYVLFAHGLRTVIDAPIAFLSEGATLGAAVVSALAVVFIEFRLYRGLILDAGVLPDRATTKAGALIALSPPGWVLVAAIVLALNPGVLESLQAQ